MSSEKEPIFNAPWPAVAVAVVIVGGYFLQGFFPQQLVLPRWGFSAPALAAGHPETLVTAMFLHGSWGHALSNGAFGLAFATPVARYFGMRGRGLLAFALFYLVTGALGNLAFGLLHPRDLGPLIGASGAVSGLAAAASRIAAGRGEVGSQFSPLVAGMAGGWIITNLLIAVLGFAPGTGGANVAWEVHLVGFALGLFLIRPLGALAGRVRAD